MLPASGYLVVATRRTPALTRQARELFEEEFRHLGWQPGGTCPRIAIITGLSQSQVRDALFSKSADEWRRDFAYRLGLKGVPLNASS